MRRLLLRSEHNFLIVEVMKECRETMRPARSCMREQREGETRMMEGEGEREGRS